MFTHIVFFKLKDKSPENVEKAANILRAMEGQISQLKELTVGKDVVHSARSFDIGIITKFNSHEEMDEYQVCPFHVNQVLAKLKPMLESSAAIDFEE